MSANEKPRTSAGAGSKWRLLILHLRDDTARYVVLQR